MPVIKKYLSLFFILFVGSAKAQKIDSIYINLYTDSLKPGTFNYINVDGLYSDGTWLPLDTTEISFSATHGVFYGNTLWIDSSIIKDPVKIKAQLRKNKSICDHPLDHKNLRSRLPRFRTFAT